MTEKDWLKRLREQDDRETRLAFADWLEEQGHRIAAAYQRDKAGVSLVRLRLVMLGEVVGMSSTEHHLGIWRQLGSLLNARAKLAEFHPTCSFRIEVVEIRMEIIGETTEEQFRSKLKG